MANFLHSAVLHKYNNARLVSIFRETGNELKMKERVKSFIELNLLLDVSRKD